MTVRAAMLSFAHVHAGDYARQAGQNPRIELVAAWDEDPARGKVEADTLGLPFSTSLDDVLGNGSVDAVILNAPTSLHYEILMQSISAGKHIFTEKALTLTTREADDVVAAVHGSDIRFMISLPRRTTAESQFARQIVDDGIIGDLTAIRGRIGHSGALDSWFGPGNWFRDARLAGGGALFDLGCHMVDVVRWFGGTPRAVISRVLNTSGVYEIDDNSVAIVEFANKALGTIDVSWIQRAGPNAFELYGTRGALTIGAGPSPTGVQLWSDRLTIAGMERAQGAFTPRVLPKPLPMPMVQWVDAIEDGTPMSITVDDGRNLTELLEAIYRSQADGRAISLPLA